MGKEKLLDNELMDMFQEGRFVARALQADPWFRGKAKSDQAEDEIKYLNVKKYQEGEHANVERHGQRGRSGTLIVPEVEMTLFDSVGFLYDADKSTIKAYMFKDSQTMSQALYDEYHNINIDKKKFEPILSRKKFIDEYRDYMEKAYNPELRDDKRNYENAEYYERYNEVLGNFFPESLVGIIGKDTSLETKKKLLHLKTVLSKHDENMPMVLMDKGQVKVWTPDLNEIANILNHQKGEILKYTKENPEANASELLQQYANDLGYQIDDINFYKPLTAQNIHLNNQFEFKADEIIDYLSQVTDIPKGGSFSYGIEGRLLEVVNQKLESDGKEKVNDLNTTVIEEKDIQNLVSMLDKEMKLNKPSHTVMKQNDIKVISSTIVSNINKIRSGEDIDPKNKVKIDAKTSKIAEFFNKVSSFFQKNVIKKKIDKSTEFKAKIQAIKADLDTEHDIKPTPSA